MDLRPLDEAVSVAPMLEPGDMALLAATGVTTIICNRPDAEVPPTHRASAMQQAAEAAGIAFVYNPVTMPSLTAEAVEEQADALDGAGGGVVAYCRSGTRSAVLWALAMAGRMPVDDILARIEAAGYPMPGLRAQLVTLEDGA